MFTAKVRWSQNEGEKSQGGYGKLEMVVNDLDKQGETLLPR